MPVIFHGPAGPKEIVPAPFVSIEKTYVFDGQGNVLHPQYSLTLDGTIVPVASGEFGDLVRNGQIDFGMDNIVRQQVAMRDLFSQQYGRLEINSPGGGPDTIHAFCQVQGLNFEEGTWVQTCDYTVNLTTAELLDEEGPSSDLITSNSEDWSINEEENGTFALTHTVSAVGLIHAEVSGLVDAQSAAREWVRKYSYAINGSNLSSTDNPFDLSTLLSDLSSPSGNYWNYSLSESAGLSENSWELTETFIHFSGGNTREEWTAVTNQTTDNQNGDTIALAGTILGHADRGSDMNLRFSNASGQFVSFVRPLLATRAAVYAPPGTTLNPVASTRSVTYDRTNGAVNYNYTFNATACNLISGAIIEDISIVDAGQNDIFAEIPVPGRSEGPVVQYMNTKSLSTRTISINATIQLPLSGCATLDSFKTLYENAPDTDNIIVALQPDKGFFYITQDQQTWNPVQGKYSRNVAWTLQPEGQVVTGTPTAPNNPDI